MNIKFEAIVLSGLIFFSTIAKAQVLEASVENTSVPLGEVFNLNISFDGDNANGLQPDLRDLNKDFKVYSTSSSTQINFINGVKSQVQDWDIGLIAKREGKVVIPAISVGKYQTKPLTLEVKSSGAETLKTADNIKSDNSLAQAAKFDIDMQIDVKNPFVQQEVNAVLTIKDNKGLQLTAEPRFVNTDGWIIKSLQKPTVVQNGTNSREIKFYYALFPQKSGSLQIPAVNVEGFYVSFEPTKRKPLMRGHGFADFFQIIDEGFDNMIGTQHPVSLYSKPIEIKVKPSISEFATDWWLPASSVKLSARWESNKPLFKVGETVTREIILEATGVADTQLPELGFADDELFKVYPDNPQISSNVVDNKVVSEAVIRVVYIPQKGGDAVIPEIKLPWFDVSKRQMQVATIPAEKIFVEGTTLTTTPKVVAPTNNVEAEDKVSEAKAQNDDAVAEEKNDESVKQTEMLNLSVVIVSVLAAFVLGIMLCYFVMRKQAVTGGKAVAGKILNLIEENLQDKDYRALRDNLIKWGNEAFPTKNIANLNDLSVIIRSKEFTEQMENLNSVLYAGANIPLNANLIINTLKSCSKKKKKHESEPLPDLYL